MAGVDFWGNYRQGQAAREFEDTYDTRKRGLEAEVGRREFALDQAKQAEDRDNEWSTNLGNLAGAWQLYQGQQNQTTDFRSFFQDWIRQANSVNQGGIAGSEGINAIPNNGKGIGHTKMGPSMPSGGGGGGMSGSGSGINSGDYGAVASGGYY